MTSHPDAEDDLDFTAPSKPSPPPPPEKMASARKEATTGSPQLAKTGFYVAMARNAGGRVTPRNGSRHSIFIIEDDKALSELVGEVLAKGGFLTRFARNRGEINNEFNKPPLPDLVLLDVKLPDADGYVTKPFKISGLVQAVNTVLGIEEKT